MLTGDLWSVIVGDARELPLEDRSVQAVCTSPPYFGLRSYGSSDAEIGKERDLDSYVRSIVDVMRICRAKLRDDGCAWINLGDSYAGSHGTGTTNGADRAGRRKPPSAGHMPDVGLDGGNALLVPFRVAAALQADGWTLRAMLPWVKAASMPESVQSRPCIAHEYVLFLTKRPSGYFYDADAVRMSNAASTEARADIPRKASAKDRVRGTTNGHGGTRAVEGTIVADSYANPAGRSLRSSDLWRAGAREAGEALLAAANGQAIGLLTNDDAPAALVVNPKGSGIPHFAMWPARLVIPMLLASTPEAGACEVCGAPWVRVVETARTLEAGRRAPGLGTTFEARAHMAGGEATSGLHRTRAHRALGFRPSCPHVDAPTVPALVFDPFSGAGTTLGVASALGRRSVGCELYAKNAALVEQRVGIVRGEVAEYLRERSEGDKAAAIESAATGQLDIFARRP